MEAYIACSADRLRSLTARRKRNGDRFRPLGMCGSRLLSDIFTEDALAGMVVGFVAGAAVVGGGVPEYTYAVSGSADFTGEKPTTAGDYVVKANVPAAGNYQAGEATAEFTIEAPIPTVTVKFMDTATELTVDVNTPASEIADQAPVLPDKDPQYNTFGGWKDEEGTTVIIMAPVGTYTAGIKEYTWQ